jgi:nucleoside 2-deoxyribosyltransferase
MRFACRGDLMLSWGMVHRSGDAAPPRKGTAMKIYLAGPLGFSEAGRAFHEGTIVREIARLGHAPLDPWAMEPTEPALAAEITAAIAMPYGDAKRDTWRKLNMRIGAKNRALIDGCDMVFAVLDGVDVDSGTAAEIGYACAKGKPILGYRGDFRLSADNEGSIINLQVEYFIRASGGEIIMAIKDLAPALDRIAAGTSG